MGTLQAGPLHIFYLGSQPSTYATLGRRFLRDVRALHSFFVRFNSVGRSSLLFGVFRQSGCPVFYVLFAGPREVSPREIVIRASHPHDRFTCPHCSPTLFREKINTNLWLCQIAATHSGPNLALYQAPRLQGRWLKQNTTRAIPTAGPVFGIVTLEIPHRLIV